MRTTRFVTIDNWRSDIDGHCTLTKLSCPVPEYVERRQSVDGMDGDLDFSESTGGLGRVVYKSRKLDMTFESSFGTRSDRLLMVQNLINAVHGKSCRFILPDRPNEHIDGRASIKLLTDALNYTEFSVSAVCFPFFEENSPTTIRLPVLTPNDNLIRTARITFNAAASSCQNATFGSLDEFRLPASNELSTAVWKIELDPNTNYYFASRIQYGRGTCSLSLIPDDDGVSSGSMITTDESGIVYLRITKYATSALSLTPVCIFRAPAGSRVDIGARPAQIEPEATNPLLELVVISDGQFGFRYLRQNPVYQLPAHVQDVILWIRGMPLWANIPLPDYLTISWRRSAL